MPTASASTTREARRRGREGIMVEASGDRVNVSTRKRRCVLNHVRAHGFWYEGCRRARGPAGCYSATTACTLNMAACGSMHWATMSSSGTSIGPFVACVPSSFTLLANSTVFCHSEPRALPDQKGPGESEPTLSPGRVPRVAGSGLFGAAACGWPLDHSVRGHRCVKLLATEERVGELVVTGLVHVKAPDRGTTEQRRQAMPGPRGSMIPGNIAQARSTRLY